MKNIKIIYILTIILFLSACSEKDGKNPEPDNAVTETADNEIVITNEQFSIASMQLGKIIENSFAERILVTGITDVPPKFKADVSVFYGGTVKLVNLLVGQYVKKGDILFTMENPDYVQMQQDYLVAKNQLDYLKNEYERQKKLHTENVASQKKYGKAKSDYYTVLTNYKALEKKLELIGFNPHKLDYNTISATTFIKAPISGHITQVNITRGMLLNSNEVAVSIVGSEHIHLELKVFEKDIKKVKEGQTIRFNLPDNSLKIYEGVIFLVGKTVNEKDRSVNVHAHLKNESQTPDFIPGMYIEGEILVNETQSPALPTDAIVTIENKNYVLIKKSFDGNKYVFEKREIKTGIINHGLVKIIDAKGLEDAEIVIKGAFNLIQ